ncbi:hypothetical protein [Maritalea sp. S77]|uniref:hypothetical protein n=1 Tax=Maritalea sp. S77 TaxID=3415125 RepID=UPI003C7B731B
MPNPTFVPTDKQLVDYILASGAHNRAKVVESIVGEYVPYLDRYRDIRYPIRDYYLTQDFENTLGATKRRLLARIHNIDDNTEAAILDEIDAIDLVSSTRIFPRVEKYRLLKANSTERKNNLNGLILKSSGSIKLRKYKTNSAEIGLLFPLIRKGNTKHGNENQMRQKRVKLHCTLLHMHADQIAIKNETAAKNLCIVHDVFEQKLHLASKSDKRLKQEILASCAELASALEQIQIEPNAKSLIAKRVV